MGVDHRTRWCDIASGGIPANSYLLRGLSIENRSAVMIQQTGFGYFFKNLEYPCPYWTLRDTRLRVAEEMLDCAMT